MSTISVSIPTSPRPHVTGSPRPWCSAVSSPWCSPPATHRPSHRPGKPPLRRHAPPTRHTFRLIARPAATSANSSARTCRRGGCSRFSGSRAKAGVPAQTSSFVVIAELRTIANAFVGRIDFLKTGYAPANGGSVWAISEQTLMFIPGGHRLQVTLNSGTTGVGSYGCTISGYSGRLSPALSSAEFQSGIDLKEVTEAGVAGGAVGRRRLPIVGLAPRWRRGPDALKGI